MGNLRIFYLLEQFKANRTIKGSEKIYEEVENNILSPILKQKLIEENLINNGDESA